MNRYAKDRRDRYHAPKVQRVTLDTAHLLPRLIAAAVLLVVGAFFITKAITGQVNADKGWQEIDISYSEDMGCGSDFLFLYNVGQTKQSANAEKSAVSECYTQACVDAYQIFSGDVSREEDAGLYDLCQNPNVTLTVDDALYQAFSELEDSGSRYLYLAPIFTQLENLNGCETDSEAEELDPVYSEDQRAYFGEILSYANDPEAVSVELLGNDQVCLRMSEAYQAFCEENGIERVIDFYRVKNAFVCDYIADILIANGYTEGTLSSFEGYTRCLNGTEEGTLNIYDRQGDTVYQAGTAQFSGWSALVTFRDFPLTDEDSPYYYTYGDGAIRSPWVRGEDGLCHSVLADLIAVSGSESCGEMAVQLLNLYISDSTDPAQLADLQSGGISVLYCAESCIYSNISGITYDALYDRDGVTYTTAAIE